MRGSKPRTMKLPTTVPKTETDGAKTIEWVFNQDTLDTQLEALTTKLKASLPADLPKDEKLEMLLAPFVMKPLPGQKLSDENAKTVQQAVRDALKTTKAFTVESGKTSFSDALGKEWLLGDPLSKETRSTLRDTVTQRYVMLGRVVDEDERVRVFASLYDLKTGLEVAQENTRIPVKERKQAGGGDPETAQEHDVTLQFTSSKKLNFKTVQWFVDEKPEGVKTLDSENSMASTTIPLAKGKHKVKLICTGSGVRGFLGKTSYGTVKADFELDVTGDMLVEINANYDDLSQKMVLTVVAAGKAIKVNR